MEYISAEEFRKQSHKIQGELIEWFLKNKSETDIVQVELNQISEKRLYSLNLQKSKLNFKDNEIITFKNKTIRVKYEITPLLTEGQIRKFIEDKTDFKIIVNTSLEDKYHVGFNKYCSERENGDYSEIIYCDDLLQAYWKLACEIAKESVVYE